MSSLNYKYAPVWLSEKFGKVLVKKNLWIVIT